MVKIVNGEINTYLIMMRECYQTLPRVGVYWVGNPNIPPFSAPSVYVLKFEKNYCKIWIHEIPKKMFINLKRKKSFGRFLHFSQITPREPQAGGDWLAIDSHQGIETGFCGFLEAQPSSNITWNNHPF